MKTAIKGRTNAFNLYKRNLKHIHTSFTQKTTGTK